MPPLCLHVTFHCVVYIQLTLEIISKFLDLACLTFASVFLAARGSQQMTETSTASPVLRLRTLNTAEPDAAEW